MTTNSEVEVEPDGEHTDSRVGFEVSVVDGLYQLLGDLDDLLFACCRRQRSRVSRSHGGSEADGERLVYYCSNTS